jgi:acyl-CoA synthetase (AMP-forming)/AMP-acid ligase II
VTGRISDVINVGGLKFMASEVERVALEYMNVSLVKAISKENPITGHHVELIVQPKNEDYFNKTDFMNLLKGRLQPHMVPKRIRIEKIVVGHRFKKA